MEDEQRANIPIYGLYIRLIKFRNLCPNIFILLKEVNHQFDNQKANHEQKDGSDNNKIYLDCNKRTEVTLESIMEVIFDIIEYFVESWH